MSHLVRLMSAACVAGALGVGGCGEDTSSAGDRTTNAGAVGGGIGATDVSGGTGATSGGVVTSGVGGASDTGGVGATGGMSVSGGTGPTSGGTGTAGVSAGAAGVGASGTGAGAGIAGMGGIDPTGACSSPQVRITEVALPSAVIGNGREGDTDPIPMAIAAIPAGGSRLAWMSPDGRVYVATLDVDDHIIGTPFSFAANDFQDIASDDEGGVLAITRDAEGGGTLNCGDEGNLCIAPNDPIPCYDMLLLRFDNAGNDVWTTKLTTASTSDPPYTADSGANHFIWWYQHHTRIAYDGTNYAAYFCDAITIRNGSCVDIHEGDRMQVVGPSGSLVDHPDAFAGGCSHSWNTRIVWDERSGHFVTVCATDNQNRIARSPRYDTILSTPDVGTSSVGGLVLASGSGYWVSVSHQGMLRLLHFEEDTPDKDIPVTSADFSHLASYGSEHMIIAWESGGGMTAQVRDAGNGSEVSAELSIDVPEHRYQAMKSFPDGSVAYPAQGSGNQSIQIARVLPCEG